MKLFLILITTTYALGQETSVQIRDLKVIDIKGLYSVNWTSDEFSVIGETLELDKRKKFEYDIFATEIRSGSEKNEMLSGKYFLFGDSLVLKSKVNSYKHGEEIFSFKLTYIVKGFELTIHFDEADYLYQVICLMPTDKAEGYVEMITDLTQCLNELFTNGSENVEIDRVMGIGNLTQNYFWAKKMFVLKKLKHVNR